jgi:hypothetical protein
MNLPAFLLYRAPVIDLENVDKAAVRASLVSALAGSINPLFVISRHPALDLFERFSASALSRVKDHPTRDMILAQSQYAIDLYEETDCTVAEISALKDAMKQLTYDIMDVLLADQSFQQILDDRRLKLGGKLCVRCYPVPVLPPSSSSSSSSSSSTSATGGPAADQHAQRLGPHCDGNFLTLLFCSHPGLQVPDPALCPLAPADIVKAGIPSFGGSADSTSVEESHWKYVSHGADGACIVVSVGEQWFSSASTGAWQDVGVQCPLLHRVALPEACTFMRLSLPFLGRLFERDEVLEGEWRD